jgi:hypothetical protein
VTRNRDDGAYLRQRVMVDVSTPGRRRCWVSMENTPRTRPPAHGFVLATGNPAARGAVRRRAVPPEHDVICSIEDVRGLHWTLWFQLYVMRDRGSMSADRALEARRPACSRLISDAALRRRDPRTASPCHRAHLASARLASSALGIGALRRRRRLGNLRPFSPPHGGPAE